MICPRAHATRDRSFDQVALEELAATIKAEGRRQAREVRFA